MVSDDLCQDDEEDLDVRLNRHAEVGNAVRTMHRRAVLISRGTQALCAGCHTEYAHHD